MSGKILVRTPSVAFGFACMTVFMAAHADVTIEEKMMVEGAGVMAMANMSGTTTTSISGDRAKLDNNIMMNSKLVRMIARDMGPTSEIIRLDQDKIYDVNVKKKSYTEVSLADKRAEMTKALDQAKQAQEKQPSPTGMDESECEWSEPKVDVKKTGQKATIAGFDSEQTTIVATQSCKDKKTGAVCDVQISLDQWLAPGFDAGAEQQKFFQAYAQKMGFTGSNARDVNQRAEQLFGRYKGIWQEVATKMKNVKGYPVRTSFAMGFGGPQCKSAEGAPPTLPPAPTAGQMGAAAAEGAGQMAGEAAANKAGQSGLGGVAGQLGGKIAGALFNRKKKGEEETAAAEPAAAQAASTAPVTANNMIVPLRVTSEMVAVKKDSLPGDTFEVPAGFKKVANGS
jgi:hypothetical protein